MRITLCNNFHNCDVELNVPSIPARLSHGQTRKVYKQLCGLRDCTCGGVRGPQWLGGRRLEVESDRDKDGKDILVVTYRG